MLKKLLKYDFKAVLKLWWIAAAASVLLSLGGGMCLRIVSSDRNIHDLIQVVAGLGLALVMFSWVAFALLSTIIIFGRFYKNFFTDEGYLTFTLPVTRGQLLNSKLTVLTVTNLMSVLVIFLNIFILLAIGVEDFFPDIVKPLFEDVLPVLRDDLKEFGAYGWVILYLVEMLIIFLLGNVFSVLFLTCCITFGCIVAKKAKVITSIAIYYVANGIFSFAMQILFMFGIPSLVTWLDTITPEPQTGFGLIALMIFCAVAIMGLFCNMLYTLQYWMLDRKLNLS